MLCLCFIITKYIYLIYLFSILLLYGMFILFCSTLSLYSPSNHPAVSSRAQRPWEWDTIDWGLWNHEHLEIFLLLSWFVSGILSKQCSLPTVSLNSDGTLLISLKIGWMSLSTIHCHSFPSSSLTQDALVKRFHLWKLWMASWPSSFKSPLVW